ncbi:MAG: hypothetical protein RRB13_06585 [bacterium]|nr:hypothetical protein [bacterium]
MFDEYAFKQAARLGFWLHREKGGNVHSFWPKLDFFTPLLKGTRLEELLERMHYDELGQVDEAFLDQMAQEMTPFQKTQTLYFLDHLSERDRQDLPLAELTKMRDLYHRILFGRPLSALG